MARKSAAPYYLTAAGIFFLLKFWFKFANNDSLVFLLKPTNKFIEILTGFQSVYISESGYYHAHLNILIGKHCSGFNFLVVCFLMLNFSALQHIRQRFKKIIALPIALLLAYFLTIVANTSRIFSAIIFQSSVFLPEGKQGIIHDAIGIIINLSFLILIYHAVEKILIYRRTNAEFS